MRKQPENFFTKNVNAQPEEFEATYAWFDLRNFTEFALKTDKKTLLDLLVNYYYLIEKSALFFNGRVVARLGDGTGVLFEGKNSARKGFDMAKYFLKNLSRTGVNLRVGISIDRGKVVRGKNLPLKTIKELYIGPTVIKTYRIGSLATKMEESVLLTKSVYINLDEERKKELKFLKVAALKGFSKKVYLYHIY